MDEVCMKNGNASNKLRNPAKTYLTVGNRYKKDLYRK